MEDKLCRTPLTQRALLAIARNKEDITPAVLDKAEELALSDKKLERAMIQEKHIEKAIWESKYPNVTVVEIKYAECPECHTPQDVVEFSDEPVVCWWCGKTNLPEKYIDAL